MSFPPAGNGPSGREPGQGFVLGPDDGDAYWWLGSLTLNKVTRASTQGDMDIVDHRCRPGTPRRCTSTTSRTKCSTSSTGDFAVPVRRRALGGGPRIAGVPARRVPHGFTVSGDGPGRTLLINAPAGFADVITELGEPATRLVLPGPDVAMPTPERAGEVSEAHGIFGA